MSPLAILRATFQLQGLQLAPAAVLAARLLAIAMLVSKAAFLFEGSWLPVGLLGAAMPNLHLSPSWFAWAVTIGCLLMLFSAKVRLAAAITGTVQLVGCLQNRLYVDEGQLLIGLAWLLVALESETGPPKLLRWQYALVIGFATWARLSDADWWNGKHVVAWFTDGVATNWNRRAGLEVPIQEYFLMNQDVAISTEMGRALGLLGLAGYVGLAVLALWHLLPARPPKWCTWALLALGGLVHGVPILITNQVPDLLHPGLLVLLLAFAPWAQGRALVLFDGNCGICGDIAAWLQRLDFGGQMQVSPSQSGLGLPLGITEERTTKELVVSTGDGWVFGGYQAVKAIYALQPLFWYVSMAALVLVPRLAMAALLLFLLPLFDWFGAICYRAFARNRHHFGSTCTLPEPNQQGRP